MTTSHSAVSSKPVALPVLSYETGNGWATLGMASSVDGATRIIRQHLGDSSKSLINTYGFSLCVGLRTQLQRELNGGPDGYIWSIGKVCKTN